MTKMDTFQPPLEFFELDSLCSAIRHQIEISTRSHTPPVSSASIAHTLSARVDDLSLFKQLIPKGKYRAWMDAGYHEIFLLSFALRHQLSKIALLAHANMLEKTSASSGNEQLLAMDPFLKPSTKSALSAYRHFVSNEFWFKEMGHDNVFPIIVSSMLGCHIFFGRAGTCRARNPYAETQCTAATDSLFCDAHSSEIWWMPQPGSAPSLDAKMSLFYSDIDNAAQYDESDLEEMVGDFWKKYSKTRHIIPDDASIEQAITYFGITKSDALCKHGIEGVRRLFFQRALRMHPDTGGSSESFIELKQHYELLHEWLKVEAQ